MAGIAFAVFLFVLPIATVALSVPESPETERRRLTISELYLLAEEATKLCHLDKNGLTFAEEITQQDLYDFMKDIAGHDLGWRSGRSAYPKRAS